MKKTTFFFAVAVLALTTLASCQKQGCQTVYNGGLYTDPNCNGTPTTYIGPAPTYGNGSSTTTTTTGGTTTTGTGTGTQNTTLVAQNNQAYSDLSSSWWADLAGQNTMAGGITDMSWRYITFIPNDGPRAGQVTMGLVSSSTIKTINLNLGWNAIASIWQPLSGTGTVVFTDNFVSTGFELGNTAVSPVYQNRTIGNTTISQQQCTGLPILYVINGYSIQ